MKHYTEEQARAEAGRLNRAARSWEYRPERSRTRKSRWFVRRTRKDGPSPEAKTTQQTTQIETTKKEVSEMPGKHYVFSARTTGEGLRALNELKDSLGVSWDDLIVDAINVAYIDPLGIEVPRIPKLPKAERPPKAEKPAKPEKKVKPEKPPKAEKKAKPGKPDKKREAKQ